MPLFYKDAEGRYLGFNRAYEEVFGVRREDLLGKTVLDLAYLDEARRLQFHADAETALHNSGVVHREVPMPYADGQIHHMLYWLQGFHHADGTPGGVIGAFVDINGRQSDEHPAPAQAAVDPCHQGDKASTRLQPDEV